ncbi:hypothetical protein [Duganella sp. HH105]|uniref:hypothetical protein n=1 Tax=Duganella sp. HH105 TaxID=1781067 RepID=UPI0008931E92|nr:hypothetical protein [Duganella sp. HH105]OEZ55669.1 hypothetical protein DUGA6_53230 [Duganella sp. HH105]
MSEDSGAIFDKDGSGIAKRTTLTLPKKSNIELTDAEKNVVRLRKNFADWISNATAGFDYVATLTYSCQPRNRYEMVRKMKCFTDCYNRLLGYGCNANYYKKFDMLKAAPAFIINDWVLENGKKVNYHHHLALCKPVGMSDEEYVKLVNFCWQQCLSKELRNSEMTADDYRGIGIFIDTGEPGITEIEPIESGGWARYLAGKQSIGNQKSFDAKNSNIY